MENKTTICDSAAPGLAARRALAYRQAVRSRPVEPPPSAVPALAQFNESLPEAAHRGGM